MITEVTVFNWLSVLFPDVLSTFNPFSRWLLTPAPCPARLRPQEYRGKQNRQVAFRDSPPLRETLIEKLKRACNITSGSGKFSEEKNKTGWSERPGNRWKLLKYSDMWRPSLRRSQNLCKRAMGHLTRWGVGEAFLHVFKIWMWMHCIFNSLPLPAPPSNCCSFKTPFRA